MPRCDVHANWVKLMQFCQKAGHGEMTLTFADGVPVFAKTVMVQMRFGPVHSGLRHDTIGRQVPDRARPSGVQEAVVSEP